MHIKQVKAALNTTQDYARQYKQIYDLVQEITNTFDFEWYMDRDHKNPAISQLVINYNDGLNYIRFPLPGLEVVSQSGVTYEDSEYTNDYSIALFTLLNTHSEPITAPANITPVKQPVIAKNEVVKVANNTPDKQTILDIQTALDIDELIPMSWGYHNELPGINQHGHTYLQFEVDGSFLFKGTVQIICTGKTYSYKLINYSGMTIFERVGMTLKQTIKNLDIKIERGPSQGQYNKMVEQYFK